ncbi:HAD hydrolase-like protein [Granulicella paludicola]|uniref:HAD hydrolase-like protein n=1 Tax=Granulicella paludicola TaxID=474951 RepID=UPI0021E0E401|nr:HAD hydrolase-like protein [Granulicella paludicola]
MAVPRFLVFDLDGTLIDSSLDLCNSVNMALQDVGKPTLQNELIASYIGDGAAMLVRRALGDQGDVDSLAPDDELVQRTYRSFIEHYHLHKLDNTRCYEGVLDALTAIRRRHRDLPMAVLTNKPVHPSREICEQLGMAQFFFQNYGGNSFPTKKPDPTGLLTLITEAQQFSKEIVAENTVMIGDSSVDIYTAKRAGTRSLGCSFGIAPHTLADARPDAIVSHPSEWLVALGL